MARYQIIRGGNQQMNATELIYRRELAAEFRQAVEITALRLRIQNALGEETLEELEEALGLVHQLSTLNENRRPPHLSFGAAELRLRTSLKTKTLAFPTTDKSERFSTYASKN